MAVGAKVLSPNYAGNILVKMNGKELSILFEKRTADVWSIVNKTRLLPCVRFFFSFFFLYRFALLPSREFSPKNILRNIIFNKSSFFRIPLEYIAKSKILTGALFHRQRLRMHKGCKIEFCQLFSIHSISFINSLYRL